MKWYVVHTYSSHEFKIRDAILKGIEDTDMADDLGEIMVPTQKTFHIRQGKKVEREKKMFNSYIIIQANLTSSLRTFIQGTPGVTHFLGHGKNAHPLSEVEVNRLLGINDRDDSSTNEYQFIPGDMVNVISGPFSDFDGVVETVNEDSKKLTVKVTVFGRITPVEVNSDQVEIIK
ncbi:MAG: transcription termination/antitermination protein NusG [Candidatus Cloacimonadota bacterium]|nr:transcription termination/antitermination protein NusG [Candidatus Cloacimonadota bacterium]